MAGINWEFWWYSDYMECGGVPENKWVEDGGLCTIVNVYAPNSVALRGELWEILQELVKQASTACVCIVGDFNSIGEENERVGRAMSCDRNEMTRFNNFIEGSDLVEIQLVGRRYTWYRPDGTCKSKLDRLLVNSNWLNKWPDVILKGGEGCKKDCGPKPFKFFNQWTQHPSYKDLIETVWSSSNIRGWGGYVLKEKLKELKTELKTWSREIFNGMDRRIKEKKEEIEKLDLWDDTFGLEEDEITRRQNLLGDLMMETSWRESQWLQKSKLKWMKEGDVNTNFFHSWVKRRHKGNEIIGLWNNNTWVDSVQGVKKLVHEHFKEQFQAIEDYSVSFSDALFCTLLEPLENDLKQIKKILRLFEIASGLKVQCSRIGQGEGNNTKFWLDVWADMVCLKESFNRLYRLSRQKDAEISDMGCRVNGENKPKQGAVDKWKWRHSSDGKYSVNKAYTMLLESETGSRPVGGDQVFLKLWKTWATRKAVLTAWKILKERVATKDNLIKRGANFSTVERACPLCNKEEDNTRHLFFQCEVTFGIWGQIMKWLRISMVLHESPSTHFLQFRDYLGKGDRAKVAATIWIGVTWSIWNLRNNVVFNGKMINVERDRKSIILKLVCGIG
ncbi:hypothetical protein ACS0TY_028027 [Phlomoides rotata]